MGVTNQFDPPVPQAYTVRVQTDWYAGSQGVEVRYQLRIGERLKIAVSSPMGMVVFLPRQEPALELLPYSEALTAEKERQIWEKQGDEYARGRNQLSPYSVWYLRNKRS
jgi:hypothetical protein